ncbi:MAG TPA: FTR1 family iron permease [Aliiroseovarius sp.]|nr:FTR1 family iron permease [Aliiroseovarius sp.]
MSGQIVFIIWRESVEAMLVIGILAAWLRQSGPAATGAARYLWGGVLAGLALAVALAWAIYDLAAILPPAAFDWFTVAMMAVAASLIVQMVFWMRAHGARLARSLHRELSQAAVARHWWGVFLLAMLAVAREGSETVIFLYGMLSAGASGALAGAVALGLILALATYGLLQLGGRVLSWRLFFRFTEVTLLALGAALAVGVADKLIALGVLPYTQALWDMSAVLDDSGRLGGIVSALTGYRAAPDRVIVAVWGLYWGTIALMLRGQNRRLSHAATAAE